MRTVINVKLILCNVEALGVKTVIIKAKPYPNGSFNLQRSDLTLDFTTLVIFNCEGVIVISLSC